MRVRRFAHEPVEALAIAVLAVAQVAGSAFLWIGIPPLGFLDRQRAHQHDRLQLCLALVAGGRLLRLPVAAYTQRLVTTFFSV